VRVGRRAAVRGLAAAGLLLLGAGPLGAHATGQRYEPAPGAVLRTAPAEVRILFDGDLEPAFSTIAVADASGAAVHAGPARVDPGNRRLLRVPLRPLGPGTYSVTWRALAVDGHRTRGRYTFTVRLA
jgi:methionine-rich copper-binding protein CopC